MPEWKLHALENDRKITPQKITEISILENARMEIVHPGKCQNGKYTTWKIPEWKLHALENDRKIIPRNMTENAVRIRQNGKCQNENCTP